MTSPKPNQTVGQELARKHMVGAYYDAELAAEIDAALSAVQAEPVSLDRCAEAVCAGMEWVYEKPPIRARHVAKAVLEAAGMKYVE